MRYLLSLTIILLLTTFSLSAQEKGVTPLQNPESTNQNPETYAVVVGISDYQDPAIPDLQYAHRDAEAFAEYLRSPAGGSLDEDHLKVLLNQEATMARFATALDWLWEAAQEGDQAIIYFSGHGDVEKKSLTQPGFLLCWDAPAQIYMAGGAFPLPMLQEVISTISVQNKAQVLMVADACRSGKLSGSSVNGAQITGSNLARQYANEVKILSCQPEEYSIEGEQWGGGRGVFSYHLIDALYGLADHNEDMIVNLLEIERYLEDKVMTEAAPHSQIPLTVGSKATRMAVVDDELLQQIRAEKQDQLLTMSGTDSRGLEDEVLADLDTSIQRQYAAFQNALQQKQFFSPEQESADALYARLSEVPELERLHPSMRRNYAAALQDDAQQVINTWLKADVQQLICIGKSLKLEPIPRYLERAADLLGQDHYMYAYLKARQYLFEGINAQKHANPDAEMARKCLSLLRLSAELEPQSPLPWHRMSLVYVQNLRKADSAFICAEQARRISPNWVLPYVDLSYACLNILKNELAEKAIAIADSIQPDHPYVINRRAGIYLKTGRLEEAQAAFERYDTSGGPKYPCWYNDYAILLEDLGRYEEAENQINQGLMKDSTNLTLKGKLAGLYNKTGRWAEAEQIFMAILEEDSSNHVTWFNLAHNYQQSGRLPEAEATFRKAIEIDSSINLPWQRLGEIYMSTGRPGEAIRVLETSIALDSTDGQAYVLLGTVYQRMRQYLPAIRILKKGAEMDPRNLHILNELGYIYILTHQFAEAEDIFLELIEIDSTNPAFWNNLANSYRNRNMNEQAERTYQKAFEVAPDFLQTFENYGGFHFRLGNYDQALATYQKAISLDSSLLQFWFLTGYSAYLGKQFDIAEEALRKFSSMKSGVSIAHAYLGATLNKMGRYTEAGEELQRALKLDPTNSFAESQLGYRHFLQGNLEEAEAQYDRVLKKTPGATDALLGKTYLAIKKEKIEEAFSYLNKTLYGEIDYPMLDQDPELTPLKEYPQWEEIMKKRFPKKFED